MKGLVNLTRSILSINLLVISILHINFISLIYALCFLSIPWPLISSHAFRSKYFFCLALLVLILSSCFISINISLQILTFTDKGKRLLDRECSLTVRILAYFGWILWIHTTRKILFICISFLHGILICSSLGILFIRNGIVEQHESHVETASVNHFQSIPQRIRPLFVYFRSMFLLILIYTCGCLNPSLISSFYFFVSLGLAFWWALGKHFGRIYLYVIRLLKFYSLIHLILILISQYSFIEVNDHLRKSLGLMSLYENPCQSKSIDSIHWIDRFHPFILLILYWITIYEYYQTENYLHSKNSHQSIQNNNSSLSERLHLHSLTDLFWSQPSAQFYETHSLLVAFISYILTKAYMLSIIAMFLWSVLYHSYLTLPFLLSACLIWLLPNSKYWCLVFSPVFCIYAYILLLMNYLHNLNLIRKDFVKEFLDYSDDRIEIYLNCLIKFSFTILFLLSYHQRRQEFNRTSNPYERIHLTAPIKPEQFSSQSYFKYQYDLIHYELYYLVYTRYAHRYLSNFLFHWSRLFIIILIFLLSYDSYSSPVAYRIIYMSFFLHYHLCYSLNYYFWKIYLFPFDLTIIIYSMSIFFLIYIYQFQQFNQIFQTFSCQIIFSSIGIRSVEKKNLTNELLIPMVFIITIVIHRHFFHRNQQQQQQQQQSIIDENQITNLRILNWINSLKIYFDRIQILLWNLAERFIYKIVLVMICFTFTKQSNLSPINCLVMMIFICSFFFPNIQIYSLAIYALISTVYILLHMIIRLELFDHIELIQNHCSQIDPLEWFGLSTHQMSVGQLIMPYLIVVLSISILQLVRRHSQTPSLIEMFDSKKILSQYGFELAIFSSLCLISFRMDGIAVLHAIWIFILMFFPRNYVKKFWKLYRIFSSIVAIWLYLNALGLPPILCLNYVHNRIWLQFKGYFYLSDYVEWRPRAKHLFFDFLLIIILSIQELNFTFEQIPIDSNQSIQPNRLNDFITNCSLSWTNRLKTFISLYLFWFLIVYLYIIVIIHQSIFYLLILLICFYLLWYGQSFLQRTIQQQQSFWYLVIFSFCSLVLAHLILQPLICMFNEDLSKQYQFLLDHIFNVHCSIDIFSFKQQQSRLIIFDLFAFIFVLFFLRLLNSTSFIYVRLELHTENQLSQIGASLLSQLNWLKLVEYRQRTNQELDSIKTRVTQIRQRRNMQKREVDIPEPIYHYSAILSGDYYMFDTIDEVNGSQTSSIVHNSNDLNNSQTNESNQIRKTLDTMNSRLIVYLGQHVRTLLIISQVISDAKLYLKYPITPMTNTYEDMSVNRDSATILLTFLISKFDYLTYLTLILNFLASGGALIWLPLLLSIYFWAILTFPYPSRRFWYVITLSSMFILFLQYNLTFISSNSYIRHSLIGHLNLFANILLLGVLSFHRIVLHQLGLWDDFHFPMNDSSLIYQTNVTPSDTNRFRNEIIQNIYSMLKTQIENDKNLQTKNSNALHDDDNPSEQINLSFCSIKDLFSTIKNFYNYAIACPIVPKVDYYSSMFFCDFLVLFLIIAGHQRFSHSDSVQDNIIYRYLQGSSSLDITPIMMLLAHFLLIIVDRIIYLKKHVYAKFIFLYFQFIVLHIWLVIIYPIWFEREISNNWAAVSIYILKSIYFMLSALQIRNGYPTRILGNFLTTHYSFLRLICYKLYCSIPFLYEMRVLMDWMFIPTSLSLTYYFMMEEIARNAWIQKCWGVLDAKTPIKRAQNRGRCERYCVGGWILFAIIFVIWFPLIFFSASTSLADPIPIDRCEIKVRLSTYKELYHLVTANVNDLNATEFDTQIRPLILNSTFASGPRELAAADVACIHALGHVGTQWTISPSALNQLKIELTNFLDNPHTDPPQIYFDYSFIRKGQTNEQETLPSDYSRTLSGTHNISLTNENARILLRMLAVENQTRETIILERFLPKFIHLLPDMIDVTSPTYAQDIQLTLRREKQLLWWDIAEIGNSHWQSKCSFDRQSLNLITISERAGAQSKSFNFISKLLIGSNAKLTLIGVYAGLVYVLWLTCFRQTLFSDIQLIMYQQWPFADRIERLCEEIYLVRELGELQLEEELFARLIFLHRSPETLIRFTRPKHFHES